MNHTLSPEFIEGLPELYKADVVVIGGGPGGIGAAVMASRAGGKTILVEQYGQIGGMASIGEVQPFMPNNLTNFGSMDRPVFFQWREKIGDYLPEVWKGVKLRGHDLVNPAAAALAGEDLLLEAGVKILYHHTLTGALVKDRKIKRAALFSKSGFSAVTGKIFCDCTGDGDLSVFAGCSFDYGDEEGIPQPMTTNFKLGGIEIPPDEELPEWNRKLQEFFRRNQEKGRISAPRETLLYFHYCQKGILHFNTTRVIRKDPVNGCERSEAEILSRKQIREIYTCLKEEIPEFRNAFFVSMAPSIGVRESRHIRGRNRITREAFMERAHYPDGIARCNYAMDIHSGKGIGTRGAGMPPNAFYEIPYGCIVASDVDNLLLGGRLLSVDSNIHSSCRIMPCACSIGQAAGAAAAMAVEKGVLPGELDGVLVRGFLKNMGAFLD